MSFLLNQLFILEISQNISSVIRTVWDTSRGITLMRIPELKTIEAAYGSTRILNYAAGDQFPNPMAPPIMVILLILSLMSGKAFKRIARLVLAPVTTKSTGQGCSIILEQIQWKVFLVIGSTWDIFSFVSPIPQRPEMPCTQGAVYRMPIKGFYAPLTTTISVFLIQHRMFKAFWVVFQMVEFPAEVDIPIKSHSGDRAAMMIASISSCPGSQSSHTFEDIILMILIDKLILSYLHKAKFIKFSKLSKSMFGFSAIQKNKLTINKCLIICQQWISQLNFNQV